VREGRKEPGPCRLRNQSATELQTALFAMSSCLLLGFNEGNGKPPTHLAQHLHAQGHKAGVQAVPLLAPAQRCQLVRIAALPAGVAVGGGQVAGGAGWGVMGAGMLFSLLHASVPRGALKVYVCVLAVKQVIHQE